MGVNMKHKFKVGDRVEVVNYNHHRDVNGQTGTVCAIDGGYIAVDLDSICNDPSIRHDCNGNARAGHGFWVYEGSLQLLEPSKNKLRLKLKKPFSSGDWIRCQIIDGKVIINRRDLESYLTDDCLGKIWGDVVYNQDCVEFVAAKPKLPEFITENELKLKGACREGVDFFRECRDRFERSTASHYPIIDFMGALILDGHVAWYTWMVQKFDLNQSNALPSLDVYSILRHYSGLKEKYREQENENK